MHLEILSSMPRKPNPDDKDSDINDISEHKNYISPDDDFDPDHESVPHEDGPDSEWENDSY